MSCLQAMPLHHVTIYIYIFRHTRHTRAHTHTHLAFLHDISGIHLTLAYNHVGRSAQAAFCTKRNHAGTAALHRRFLGAVSRLLYKMTAVNSG